jgi:hypothetical protein
MQQRYCGNCGSELAAGQKFCGNCGGLVQVLAQKAASSNNGQPAPPPPEPRRSGTGRTILGAALLMSGVICVLLLMLTLLLALVRPIELGGWALNLVVFGVLAAATLYGAWRNLRRAP